MTMVSLESTEELPAFPHNQADAWKENVKLECGWGPVAITGQHRATGLAVKRCVSVKDANGRFHPVFDETVTREIPAANIIFAIGQKSDLEPFRTGVEITPRNLTGVDELTLATSAQDIFAAGDAAMGPASAKAAIAQGREGAISVDRHLRDGHVHSNRREKGTVATNLPGPGVIAAPRNERAELEVEGFAERRKGFDLHATLAESMRCMTCGAKARIAGNDDCMTCHTCELRCPSEAINVHPFKEVLPITLEIHVEVN